MYALNVTDDYEDFANCKQTTDDGNDKNVVTPKIYSYQSQAVYF